MAINYSSIGGFKYPSGTTAQRPSSPRTGTTYFNTTVGALQIYQNGAWYSFQSVIAPGIPTSVVATNVSSGRAYNNGSASVAFNPVTETGGPAGSFTVTSSPGSYTATGSSSPLVITGLQSSTGYTYTVTATNSAGTSSASAASSSVTATTVPQAPTIGSPTNTTGTQYNSSTNSVSIPVTANATGGSSITGYTVTSSPGSFVGTGSSSPVTVTGLLVGTEYTFTATATNANGASSSSSSSSAITPTTVPQAPTIGTATGGESSATLTFTAAATGGSAITNYKYSTDGTNYTAFSPAQTTSPLTISGLTNGTSYSFYLKSVNANGDSAASGQSNSVTPAVVGHVGASWTTVSLPRSQNWTAIRSNGSRFVAVADSSIYAATSTDGTNWTETTLPLGLGNANVAWNGSIWLALAYNQAGQAGSIATSPDGITWTSRTKPSQYGATHALAAKGNTFANQGTNQGRTFITTDGISFTQGSASAFGWWGMTANSSIYVAPTYYGNTAFGVSTDGLNWTNYNAPTGQDQFDIAWNGSVFASPAYNSSIVQTSPDGQTWTNRTLPASGLWSAIAWSGVSFVTIAAGGTIAATSPDGITWTQRTLPSTNNVVDTCIAALNGVFVAVQNGSQTAFKSTS